MDNLPASPPPGPGYTRWILLFILVGMCILTYTLMVINAYKYFAGKPKQTPQEATSVGSSATAISGSIDLNGKPVDGSTIIIEVSRHNGPFSQAVENISPKDDAIWSWNEAALGNEYTLVARLMKNGSVIASSEKLTVIAPATSQMLTINVPPSETPSTPSVISGTFHINGYIPSGSTITLATKKHGENDFIPDDANISATDNNGWVFSKALENESYEVQATLKNNGTVIGTSEVIQVTAPATNEQLTINSSAASASPSTVSISGMIQLNGYIPFAGNYITLEIKPVGTAEFTPLSSTIASKNGISWVYADAKLGQLYDIQANVWQNKSLAAQSQVITVAAPATGQLLIINISPSFSPPVTPTQAASISASPSPVLSPTPVVAPRLSLPVVSQVPTNSVSH